MLDLGTNIQENSVSAGYARGSRETIIKIEMLRQKKKKKSILQTQAKDLWVCGECGECGDESLRGVRADGLPGDSGRARALEGKERTTADISHLSE